MKNPKNILWSFVGGVALGLYFHSHPQEWISTLNTNVFQTIGQVFLRLIFMIVVPMIFCAMILGVYELSQGKGLGKVALRTLYYTVIASAISVVIGISLVNIFKPGVGVEVDTQIISEQSALVNTIKQNATNAKSISQTIIDLIPKNPLEAAVKVFDGEILAFLFFILIFGIALSSVSEKEKVNNFISILEVIFQACMKIVTIAMKLAPFAIFCLIFGTAYKFGIEIFSSLLIYILLVVVGLAIQQFGVYSLLLSLIAKRNPLEFFRDIREVMVYAFSTASSNATLPKALEVAESKLKIPSRISRFVLTVGSTANQNGTALFEGITVLFLAQVYQVDLSLGDQIQVVLMSILAGIGTAGVPGGSLPFIMILLQAVGIPAEGIALILGVDRFLDMCRTTVNVSGDLMIACLVGKNIKQT